MSRTNIDLNESLILKAMRYTGAKTKKEAVHLALEQLVRLGAQKEILKLEGKVKWQGSLSQMRKKRFDPR